jgi:hypothetical protein
MKYVKLFETFTSSGSGMNPVIIAKGDWSGILLDPTNENISLNASFIQPSTFIVDYLTNPKAGEAPEYKYDDDIYDDIEIIVEDIVSGDQNGHILAPSDFKYPSHPKGTQGDMDEKNGIQRMVLDPSIDPEEIRSALQEAVDIINSQPYDQEGIEAEAIATDPSASSIYTPEFIAHCKRIIAGKSSSMNRELVFNIK